MKLKQGILGLFLKFFQIGEIHISYYSDLFRIPTNEPMVSDFESNDWYM